MSSSATKDSAPSVRYTEQQTAAITHPLRPLLIVAGAGSGKTSVMAARIMHTANVVDQRRILGLTFSNKAAAHLRSAVVRSLGADSDVVISTYHGFGASIVNEWGTRLGLPRTVRLLDHAQALQLLYDVFESTSYTHRKTGRPLGILQDALLLSSRLSDHLVPLATLQADCDRLMTSPAVGQYVAAAAAKRAELIPLIAQYRARKLELGLLDHDDQISLAFQLVSTHTDICEALQERHRAVLLDEYQDTNYAQRRLLQELFTSEAAPPVTAVGDDMQSIYGFRGAHLANLHGFVSHFDQETPAAPALILGVSFRNDRNVLQLANRIQAQVNNAQPKTLQPHAGAATGTLKSILAADSWSEASHIARHLQTLIHAGTRPSEIAILCRKKKLIGPIVEALEAASIPAEVIGLGGLLIRPEVIELRCWLEVLGYSDERRTAVPLLRLLRGPRYRIGLHDLAALAARPPRPPHQAPHQAPPEPRSADPAEPADAADGEAPVEPAAPAERVPGGIEAGLANLATRELSPEAVDRLTRFNAERAALQQAATQLPLGELIDHILTYTGLWQAVDGDLPAENLARFLHVADQFVPLQGMRSLEEFLNWLSVMDESETDLSEAVQSGANAVQVMTIHQAKGLEFDHVVIPGLAANATSQFFPDTSRNEFPPTNSAAVPHWLRADNDGQVDPPADKAISALRAAARNRQLDEEWRLFYVAVTRARHGVLFSAAHWYGDTQKPQGPSMFFTWINEQRDLVTTLVPDEQVSAEAPGTAERRRRQELATVQRANDATRETAAASRRAPRSTKRGGAAQLGFSFAAGSLAPSVVAPPRSLPVSAFSLVARCARQFHWTHVRPMPQQSSAAAVIGTKVHSWIESHGARLQFDARQPSLFQLPEPPAPTPPITAPQAAASQAASHSPGSQAADHSSSQRDGFQQSFLKSRYQSHAPLHIELPITLNANGLLVRGRVDAIYQDPHTGTVRIVDFKTGRQPLPDDPGAPTQLDLYGLALQDRLGVTPELITTSALYLHQDGSAPAEHERQWSQHRAEEARQLLHRSVARVQAGDQQPSTGSWCRRCPYQDLCPEGSAHVEPANDPAGRPADEIDDAFTDPFVLSTQSGQATDLMAGTGTP